MKLRPTTKAEYDEYLEKSIKSYANELLTSGMVPKENVEAEAQATFNRILPDGFNTKNHYFFHAYEKEEFIGFIWYGMRKDTAFIYDFYIAEKMRRKGYGRQVMILCEEDAKEKGAKAMALHVFGHNKAARALYESLDYIPTSIQMKKELK